MGKLYDRHDLECDLDDLDALEQSAAQQIAAGTLDALKAPAIVEMFDKERRRARMDLLRTGQIMSDLRAAEACFNRRPSETNKRRFTYCKRVAHWAGIENLRRRQVAGRLRPSDNLDGAVSQIFREIPNELTATEKRYLHDFREGNWPYEGAALDGYVGYTGWLLWSFQRGKITHDEYTEAREALKETL